jgi:hypothetical protein
VLVRAETSGVEDHFRIDCYVQKLSAPKLRQRDLAWVPIENAKRWTNGISVSIFICIALGPMYISMFVHHPSSDRWLLFIYPISKHRSRIVFDRDVFMDDVGHP